MDKKPIIRVRDVMKTDFDDRRHRHRRRSPEEDEVAEDLGAGGHQTARRR